MVAGVFIEKLFRLAPVQDPPSTFMPDHFMTKCLDVGRYLAPALELIIDEGLLRREDDGGDDVPVHFADADEMYKAADALVKELKDSPEMLVKPEHLEWQQLGEGGGPRVVPRPHDGQSVARRRPASVRRPRPGRWPALPGGRAEPARVARASVSEE